MDTFFPKNRKLIIAVITVWTVLLLLFIAVVVNKISQSGRFSKQLTEKAESETILAGGENDTIRNLYKEKWWYEQQLAVSKSDSFSLGINLYDSIIQVQLKGTVLFQANILKHTPEQFFRNADEKLYRMLFEEVSRIDSSEANIPKKPIKKVIAPKVGDESKESKTDTLKEDFLVWHFFTDKNIEVLIYGVQQEIDSTSIKIESNLKVSRFDEGLNNPFKPQNTIPLVMWLNDQDAKSIYRALPHKSRVIIRD